MVPVNSTEASERDFEALLRRREEKMALTPFKLVHGNCVYFDGIHSKTVGASRKFERLLVIQSESTLSLTHSLTRSLTHSLQAGSRSVSDQG